MTKNKKPIEIINGKPYFSIIDISKEFNLSPSILYNRRNKNYHGNDLIKPVSSLRSNKNMDIIINNQHFYSINAIAKQLNVSNTAINTRFKKSRTNKSFQAKINALMKSQSHNSNQKSTVEKSKIKIVSAKPIVEKPIDELREPTIQKVSALYSLLLKFIGEFTGYSVNVRDFENHYDKGLDLPLSNFITKTDIVKTPNQEIVSKETLEKISSLESEITNLKEQIKIISTPKKHWWSK